MNEGVAYAVIQNNRNKITIGVTLKNFQQIGYHVCFAETMDLTFIYFAVGYLFSCSSTSCV